MNATERTEWVGCYEDGWQGLIIDEAFAHPAKMARGLLVRIFDYLFETGALHVGDTVVDPFGGVATTAIEGSWRGCNVVCCELEPRFVELGCKNIAMHADKLRAMGKPVPRIVQGDSRRLAEIVGQAGCVVGSPPFCDNGANLGDVSPVNGRRQEISARSVNRTDAYGTSHGQLGSMPAGSIDSVISSPPYAGEITGKHGETETAAESRAKRQTEGGSLGQSMRHGGYGTSDGNLSNLAAGTVDACVSSPPYSSGTVHDGNGIDADKLTGNKAGARSQAVTMDGYGQTPGQLAALPAGGVEAVVSSPPYEGSFSGGEKVEPDALASDMRRRGCTDEAIKKAVGNGHTGGLGYGTADGQLGQEQGETFWLAARQILLQCHQILKPGGVAVWVCKDFVRKGQRVTFSDDWIRLCEACGFILVERIYASLLKHDVAPDLFGGENRKTKSRKSFFRRLAEKKGSPPIDHEDVIVVRKATLPTTEGVK